MSEEKPETAPEITLENATYPRAFLSLASALVASLSEEGMAIMRVNDAGVIERVPKDMITWVEPPVLLVDPAFIIEHDENTGRIVVDIKGCTLVRSLAVGVEE